MTGPDLDALVALLDKATPGPWATNGTRVECRDEHGWVNDGWIVGDLDGPDAEANAALIVSAVNALPAMLAYVRELERERDQAISIRNVFADGLVRSVVDKTDNLQGQPVDKTAESQARAAAIRGIEP